MNHPKICGNCPFMEKLLIRKRGRKDYVLHGEKYKQLIIKIYSLNNIAILCWSYVVISTKPTVKTKKPYRFTISFDYKLLSKKWCRKLLKKKDWILKYII